MLKINFKQLIMFISVGLIAVSCSDDDNPASTEDHVDAEGFALEIDGTEVYRQLEGEITGDLSVVVGETLELTIHFLDHDGNEIEHEDEEGEEEELSFADYDAAVILLAPEEHCDEITDETECGESDHCEWHADEGLCEDEGHDDGHNHDEHHALGFELTGLSAGETTFTLSLMHDGHSDYTSFPISVEVVTE